jgi:hypothetical protein
MTRILRDPRIAGFDAVPVPSGDRKTSGARTYRIVRDEDGNPVQTHKPIIEPARWYQLQEVLDSTRRFPGRKCEEKKESLLGRLGVFVCDHDSTMMTFNGAKRYLCQRPAGKRNHRGNNGVNQPDVDEWVARRILARLSAIDESDPDDVALLAAASAKLSEEVTGTPTARVRRELEAERSQLDAQEAELYEFRRAGAYKGAIGAQEFVKDVESIEKARLAVGAALARLHDDAVIALPLETWAAPPDDPDGDPLGPGSWWHSAKMVDRRFLVTLFVSRITCRAHEEGKRGGNRWRPFREDRLSIEWRTTREIGGR